MITRRFLRLALRVVFASEDVQKRSRRFTRIILILALRAGCAVPVCSRQTGVEQQVLIRQGTINAKTAVMAVLTFMAHPSGFEPETSASGARKSQIIHKLRCTTMNKDGL